MADNRDPARARLGRYEAVGSASCSGPLPQEGRRGRQITIRHGAVDDLDETVPGRRRRVAINTRTDPLEHEYSRGRLSEAAYRTGRTYQRVIERTSGRALPPSFAECRIQRAEGTKRQGAVAAIIQHVMDAIAPEVV